MNRVKVREQKHQWKCANPEKLREYRRHDRKIARKRLRAYLRQLKARPCEDCGEQREPHRMHFHHLDPGGKVAMVSQLVCYSRAKLGAEIAKCVLLCAGCHRKRHA